MITITRRLYNEMGDGFEEYVLIADPDGSNVQIIFVGQFYDEHTWTKVDIGGNNA